MAAEIHVGDIGTVYTLYLRDGETPVDISTATTKQITFQDPTGTNNVKTAEFSTDGTDGILTYTFASGDIDLAGRWKTQAKVILSGGDTWFSSEESFIVHDVL